MKNITRKEFMGGVAAMAALGWRGAFAAPARRQRGYKRHDMVGSVCGG